MREVAIVHFNTPELTEAAILSLRKHGGEDYHVTIFDNSTAAEFKGGRMNYPDRRIEARPFTKKMKGVTVIDNTEGQIIDFRAELAKYPDREPQAASANDWGSVKHMLSVQKLFELLPEGFLLMDSDVLIKRNVDFMFREDKVAVGHVQEPQPGNPFGIGRLVPMLCYINVPKCLRYGIKYFDPDRSWMLHSGMLNRNNWYDTGASFMAEIREKLPRGSRGLRVDIRPYIEHYKKGSWLSDANSRKEWLEKHRNLWQPTPRMLGNKKVAICAIGRNENRYACEWVDWYLRKGVSKIYIYDNYFGNETPLAETLKDYVQGGSVELIDIHDQKDRQVHVYTDCYRRHGNEYGWIGFLDFDEFLNWNGRKKIEAMFAQYNADCVLINWKLFTDNGLTHYDPRPVRERFTQPMDVQKAVKYNWPENEHCKCFVRGGLDDVRFAGPHCPGTDMRCVNAKGERVQRLPFVRPLDHSVMWIDHFWTKTAEEWIHTKLARGYCSGRTYIDRFMTVQERYFFKVNEWSQEKEDVIRSKPLLQ